MRLAALGIVALLAFQGWPVIGPQLCSGTDKVTGINADGTFACAADETSEGGGAAWGDVTGTLSNQTDLQTALDAKEASGTFSGAGACAANSWASTLNDGAAPTCTQPGFSNLSGSATDGQVPDTISLTNITQITNRAISDTTGTLAVARGGTNLTSSADDNAMVGNGTAWETKALPDCDGDATVLHYDTTTNAFSCGDDDTGGGGGDITMRLAADVTTGANTTPVNLTGMSFTAAAATTYAVSIFGNVRAAAATTGYGFGVNCAQAPVTVAFTGVSQLANTGTVSAWQAIANNAIAGVTSGIPSANTDTGVHGGGIIVTHATNSGSCQFIYRSETTAATTAKANTVIVVRAIS